MSDKSKTAIVGIEDARTITVALLEQCKWFEVTPLPGDNIEIKAKDEPGLPDVFDRPTINDEELDAITAAVRIGAQAIATIMEFLRRATDRTNKEWSPKETSVRDIVDDFSTALDGTESPDDIKRIISKDSVHARFTNTEDWE